MDHALVDLVVRFGYLIVFLGVGIETLGIPIPGETALITGSLLAAQGRLNAAAVAGVAFAGAVMGSSAGYLVGRRHGHRLGGVPLLRAVYDERRMAVAEAFFDRHGWLVVAGGRFFPLLRIFAGPLAGMHRMPALRFTVANIAGAALWVGVVVTVVLVAGQRAISLVSQAGYAGLALVLVLAAAAWWWHRRRVRRDRAEGERLILERARRGREG